MCSITLIVCATLTPGLLQEPEDPLRAGRAALAKHQPKKAVGLLSQALKKNPKDDEIWFLRGLAYEELNEHQKAVDDYSKCLELNPKRVEALNNRGSELFKLGRIKESVQDFDRFIKLVPRSYVSHWRRGISLYYVGRFADGMKQFNAYEKFDTNDVENAVWHFLCHARKAGVKKAQESILKIGRDRRVPMMQVYQLYKGDIKPADILKAVENEKLEGAAKKHALFYAHLYLGLYAEVVEKDAKKALMHLEKATEDYPIGHYMWDVARVHRDLLKKK